jgi:hypothetical protein
MNKLPWHKGNSGKRSSKVNPVLVQGNQEGREGEFLQETIFDNSQAAKPRKNAIRIHLE